MHRFLNLLRNCTREPATKCDFIIEEIETHFASLMSQNLILIGCPDLELSLDAGYALIERLSIPDDRKWKIDLRSHLNKGTIIGIKSLLPENEQKKTKAAILVNAIHKPAEDLIESLLLESFVAESFEGILRENNVYMLCIVQSRYIDERQSDPLRELKTPFWKIPFLRPLLKQNFDDYESLEQRILCQRQKGRWKEDESEFCGEIKTFLKKGQLRKVIENRDNPVSVSVETIFKDDDYIGKSVLYSASYFRDMTSKEFCSLVESLLGNRKVFKSVPEYKQDESGSLELVHTRIEVPIINIWRDEKDPIMWKWLSETYSTKNAANVIDFSDYQMRDSIRNFLEESRRFLLKDNFRTLQEQGFLFYPSDQVAENMIGLTCDMMSAYPDEFNTDWLVELIVNIRDSFETTRASSTKRLASIAQFLKAPEASALALVYSRISELMRQLLKNQKLKEIVAGTFVELIRSRKHDCVFNLIRRLRTASEFDEFYWIKQLLNQGDMVTRLFTYGYFHHRIKTLNPNIPAACQFIEDWLPKEDRPTGQYARSSTYALRSLIQQCLEAVDVLEADSYGVWPSQYSLFAFQDRETAERSVGQMMKWLFHPAMTQALDELDKDSRTGGGFASPNNLVGALIAEWFFILMGPDKKTALYSSGANNGKSIAERSEQRSTGDADTKIDADSLVAILMRQVSLNSDKAQRKEMVEYWEQLRIDLSFLIRFSEYSLDMRAQFIWRNNRLWELISAVKKLH